MKNEALWNIRHHGRLERFQQEPGRKLCPPTHTIGTCTQTEVGLGTKGDATSGPHTTGRCSRLRRVQPSLTKLTEKTKEEPNVRNASFTHVRGLQGRREQHERRRNNKPKEACLLNTNRFFKRQRLPFCVRCNARRPPKEGPTWRGRNANKLWMREKKPSVVEIL